MSTVAWLEVQAWMLRQLDAVGRRGHGPEHLATGLRGEREALLYLRKMGYVVVARRWKTAKLWGDVDLIAWDGEWLCFVEVKTRTGRDAMTPAESAVDEDKRVMLRKMARAYLKGFPERVRGEIAVRFDVVSVYLQPSGVEFEVFRGAFGWR
jgi:putative endonuclease